MTSHRIRLFASVAVVSSLAALWAPAAILRGHGAGATDGSTIVHVLNRLGYGPTAPAIDHVKRIGVAAYVEEQLRPERIPDAAMASRLSSFSTLAMSSRELAAEYFVPAMMARRGQQRRNGHTPEDVPPAPTQRSTGQRELMRRQRTVIAELSQQRLLRAAYSERQLEEMLVDFWMNHFNVFVGKGQVRLYLSEYERDVIRPRVLGRFRDLLGATAQSPAMLFYLDNWQSTAPPGAPTSAADGRDRNARPRRLAPSNPASRGRGRRRLPDMPDAQMTRPPVIQQRPRGLNENYARELLELHTLGVDGGYSQKDVQEVARALTGWTIANPRLGGEFQFNPRMHDDGEKIVLGRRIRAGGGRKDGEQVLDLLARHPSTAHFIATKLARRLVADDPPAALVARVARRFTETDGDIRELVRTIATSPEFLGGEYRRAKTKNPLEFVVSAVRATGVDAANALPLVQSLRELGMPLYGAQPPTGYADKAEAWVNSGALLNRMNFALALAGGRMRALRARPQLAASTDEARLTIFAVALAGQASSSTAATVARATTPAQAVALTLGSPEFQKR